MVETKYIPRQLSSVIEEAYRYFPVITVTGPRQSGKTTLLRVLAGLLEPERGSVELPGRSILFFQEDRLFPGLTALGQVEAALPKARRGEAVRVLELAELGEDKNKRPGELSGGMARRVALARCLALPARLYLLDEPFAGVDLPRAERILSRVRALGRPVVLTAHEPGILALCDKVFSLSGPPLRIG